MAIAVTHPSLYSLGPPLADIFLGMESEHSFSSVSDFEFTSLNYKVSSTPSREWKIAVDGDVSLADMGHNRRIPSFDEMMSDPTVVEAGLCKAEVTSLSLFSGPMVSTLLLLSPFLIKYYDSFESVADSRCLPVLDL